MKKITIALFVTCIIIVAGCGSSKNASKSDRFEKSEEPQQEPQELNRELSLWDNQFDIKYGDPINFFNEYEITTLGSKPSYSYRMDNGVVKRLDNTQKTSFSIPAKTSGVISKAGVTKDARGKITKIKVCFFPESETYVSFSPRSGYTGFFLDPTATVYIDGIAYTIEVSIKGKGDGMCRLYFDVQDEDNSSGESKVATGIVPSGTKEIIVK